MTDSEYNDLVRFIGQHLAGTEAETKFYELLSNTPRVNIVCCSVCKFHNDCTVERVLPGDSELKFCSYGKQKF